MANIYDVNNANIYSSSSTPGEPDEISVFLQQILLRSSSSSTLMQQQQSLAAQSDHTAAENQKSVTAPVPSRIYAAEPPPVLKSSSGGCLAAAAANVCSSSAGTFDNDLDEYDYESEEAAEAVVGEAAPKPTPPRSSSKRSRAAEVHNLSEKRRRSRINEKMKALQNLIPNSNKTDKASMLDEAIEYLKQLQLQVQMLTMRNGLSLYPICLPGMLQPNQSSPVRMNVSDRYKSLNMNTPKAISMDHQNTNTDAIADFSTMIGSKTSLELESSIQDQFGSFQFSKLSQGICEEKVLPCKQQNEDFSRVGLTGKGYCPGLESSSSILFETQPSDTKKACLARGDCVLPNFVNNRNFSSQSDM